jgi:hypothetical protein
MMENRSFDQLLGWMLPANLIEKWSKSGALDWSERQPHIAGALGAALLKHAVARKWVVRELSSRTLCLTRLGERENLTHLGVKF